MDKLVKDHFEKLRVELERSTWMQGEHAQAEMNKAVRAATEFNWIDVGAMVATAKWIPTRYLSIVLSVFQNGIPLDLADLTVALDPDPGKVPFVVLVGATGAGKTTKAMALAIARRFAKQLKRKTEVEEMVRTIQRGESVSADKIYWRLRYKEADPVLVHADDICDARRFSKLGFEPAILEKAKEAELLIIDDVIGQKDTEGDLYRLLRFREEQALRTIITSGLSKPEITSAYGAMFARRMFAGASKVVSRKAEQ